MNFFSKNKKTITILSAVLIIAGIFSIFYFNKQKESSGLIQVKSGTTVGELTDLDTDGDGLKDWEEILAKTDPNNADSDGNGISDFEQVKASPENTIQTQTEAFTRDLLATLISLDRANGINKTSIENISQELANKIQNESLPDFFTKESIKIIPENKTNKEVYIKNIKKIIAKNSDQKIGIEMYIIKHHASGEISDEDYKKSLGKIIDFYKDIGVSASKLNVPENALSAHYDFINGAYNSGLALELMLNIKEDPLKGLVGIQNYQKYNTLFTNSFNKFGEYFK